MGAKAFGEQNPTGGETAVSWQTWSDGAAGIPDVDGDADWGKLKLDYNPSGEQGRSAVYDLGSAVTRTYTMTEDRYGSGSGSAVLYIRGSGASFSQDDAVPVWEEYTEAFAADWRYVQVAVTTEDLFDQQSGTMAEV